MAGAHPEVALQGDQPLQGLQNLGIAPPHKVCAPTGAGKEGVPAEEDVPHPVSHRPGGVAGGVEHLNGGAAEGAVSPSFTVWMPSTGARSMYWSPAPAQLTSFSWT